MIIIHFKKVIKFDNYCLYSQKKNMVILIFEIIGLHILHLFLNSLVVLLIWKLRKVKDENYISAVKYLFFPSIIIGSFIPFSTFIIAIIIGIGTNVRSSSEKERINKIKKIQEKLLRKEITEEQYKEEIEKIKKQDLEKTKEEIH